jgi:hypothetical protein
LNLSNLDFTSVPLVRHSLAVVSLTPPTDGLDFRASPELSPSETSLGLWASRISDGTPGPRVAINLPITATMNALAADYRPREVMKEAARSVSQLQGEALEGDYAVGLPSTDRMLLFAMDPEGRVVMASAQPDDVQPILKAFQLRRQIERLQIEPMSIDKSIPRDFAGTVILRGHSKTATLQDITDSVPQGFQGLLVYSDCDLGEVRLRNLPQADIAIVNCVGAADAIFPGELAGSLRFTNTDLCSVRLPRAIGGHVLIDGCLTDYATLLPDRVKMSFTMIGRFGESRESLLMTALPVKVGTGMELENIRATMTPFPDEVSGGIVIRNCDLSNARIETDTPELQLIESDLTRLELGPLAVRSLTTTGCYETLRENVPDFRFGTLTNKLPEGRGREGMPVSPRELAAVADPGLHHNKTDLDRFALPVLKHEER